jgi:predicted PurR-regulated permease PerM
MVLCYTGNIEAFLIAIREAGLKKKVLEQSDLIRIWTRVVLRLVFLLAAGLFLLWTMYEIRTILLLLVLSIFFSYLIAPIVRLFEHPVYIGARELKLPRAVAIGAVYLVIGASVFLVVSWLWPLLGEQITELAGNLPGYVSSGSQSFRESLNDANSWMRHVRLPKEWRDYLLGLTGHVTENILPFLKAMLVGVFGYLQYFPWLILVPVLSFFMLKDANLFGESVINMLPNERLQKRARWLLMDISNTLAAYTRAQVLSCVVVGGQVTLYLSLIQVRYALVLGAISAVFEFVPLVGPLAAAVIAVSLAMAQSFKLAMLVALILIVLRIVHDYVVYPRIIGQGIKIHPFVVVVAILVGAEIGGLTGIFLAIPVVGLIIVGYNHYTAYKNMESIREGPKQEELFPAQEGESETSLFPDSEEKLLIEGESQIEASVDIVEQPVEVAATEATVSAIDNQTVSQTTEV